MHERLLEEAPQNVAILFAASPAEAVADVALLVRQRRVPSSR